MTFQRSALSVAIAAAGMNATFFVTSFLDVPLLWMDPLTNVFSFGHRPSTVAIDFYGRTLLSGSIAAALYVLTRLLPIGPVRSEQWTRVALGWVLLSFTLTVSLYGFSLWGRRPLPEPLPKWYSPR